MPEGPRVAVYYQTQYVGNESANPPHGLYISPLPLSHHITHLLLAAFHIHRETTDIYLNDHLPEHPRYAQMWQEIALMQSQGVKVIGMLGGAGSGYEWLTGDKFLVYYPVVASCIRRYKLNGLDLDVERPTDISGIIRLIARLKADFGPDFIITLAPVASALTGGRNLSGFDYVELEQRAGASIAWYNLQFYNGFGSFAPEEYIKIVNHGRGLWRPSRLVATALSHPSNGGSGYITPEAKARNARSLVVQYGSDFGGVAAWEYFNSNPNPMEPWRWAEMMKAAMAQGEEAKPEDAENQRVV